MYTGNNQVGGYILFHFLGQSVPMDVSALFTTSTININAVIVLQTAKKPNK